MLRSRPSLQRIQFAETLQHMHVKPIGVQTAHGPAARPTARPFGTAHGRHGTADSVPVPARHEGPCGSWAAGLAHDTALTRHGRHGGTVPARPHLASSPCFPTARPHLLRLRPHLLRLTSSPLLPRPARSLSFHGRPPSSHACTVAHGRHGWHDTGKRPMCRVMG
jgi:hypothetical protein